MAASAPAPKLEFPGVNFGADKPEICVLYMKFAGLKVKKKGLFGPLVASNGTVEVSFTPEILAVNVSVEGKDNKTTLYEYKKNLPEDIDDKKSSWKIFKEERVEIKLVKVKAGSWERHAKYLCSKD